MPLTSTTSCRFQTVQQLVIDCNAVRISDDARADVLRIVEWIKNNPTAHVRVLLRSATGNVVGRQLKSTFQSLGCTVSMFTRF